MLKTVCVVISNYSKLQNIENTSQDFIHCKMQGALNGKTMHVVCRLFTQIVYTAVQPLWNYCGIKFSEIRATHEMVFFGIQVLPNSISAGDPPRSRWESLRRSSRPSSRLARTSPPHFPPTRRLRRLAHLALPFFKTFRRPWPPVQISEPTACYHGKLGPVYY